MKEFYEAVIICLAWSLPIIIWLTQTFDLPFYLYVGFVVFCALLTYGLLKE